MARLTGPKLMLVSRKANSSYQPIALTAHSISLAVALELFIQDGNVEFLRDHLRIGIGLGLQSQEHRFLV